MSKLKALTDALEEPVTVAYALVVVRRCWNQAHARMREDAQADLETLEEIRALAFCLDVLMELPIAFDLMQLRAFLRGDDNGI